MTDRLFPINKYRDVLEDPTDDEMIRVLVGLDRLLADSQPPASLVDGFDRILRDFSVNHDRARLVDNGNAMPIRERPRPISERAIVPEMDHFGSDDRGRRFKPALELVAGTLVLVLVTGLLMTIFSSHDPGLEPGGAGFDSRLTLLPRDGEFLTLSEAESRVLAFLDEPAADLTGEFLDPAALDSAPPPFPSESPPIFTFRRQVGGGGAPDSVVVDADTGEIVKALLPSRTARVLPVAPIDDVEAQVVAEEFARTRFAHFDELTRRSDPAGFVELASWRWAVGNLLDNDRSAISTFWELEDEDDNRWVATYVSVVVDRETGGVIEYTARRAEGLLLADPTLTDQNAIDIALAYVRQFWTTQTVDISGVDLQMMGNGHEVRPLWVVTFEPEVRRPTGSVGLSEIHLDAHTGHVWGMAASGGVAIPRELHERPEPAELPDSAQVRLPWRAAISARQAIEDQVSIRLGRVATVDLRTVAQVRAEEETLGLPSRLSADPTSQLWVIEFADVEYYVSCDEWEPALREKLIDPSACGSSRLVAVLDAMTGDLLTIRGSSEVAR